MAKNEERNIGKCLKSLEVCGIPAVVLDSGSVDGTLEIASDFPGCEVRSFAFRSHTEAWNLITSEWHGRDDYIIILDADMEVSPPLLAELLQAIATRPDVVLVPVRMHVDGQPLLWGSLYPPKAILFRGGAAYFIPKGHCSRLAPDLRMIRTRERLIHNDLKPYTAYLSSQVRYGELLHERYGLGKVSLKDRLRASSPLMALAFPLISLFLRAGVLAGRLGLIYSLDRAIAALVQYRVVLARREESRRRREEKQIPRDPELA